MPSLPKPSDRQADNAGALKPAVIYAAKSTDDPRGSIPTQVANSEALCVRDGLTVVGTYSDEAKSAYHGSRGEGLVQAREHAEKLAAKHGSCAIVVQHTDRLARGDGVVAEHLVGLLLWARKVGVCIRSVEDDSTGENLLMAAVMGERNHEDSKRKAAATAAGRRRAADRGEWCGPVPDGYDMKRTPHGATIVRRVVMHPDRREVYRLLWDMAIDGATVNSIVRELAARGYRTEPRRARPRPFDAARVGKVIVNPFYAGLLVSRREIIGAGNWPAYVEPDVWHRLRQERSERARYRPDPVGRPPAGLLARLARCECGAAAVQQHGGPRKDGSRKRVYTCRTHMHGAGACTALPYDAEQVERMVLGGLDKLLGDAGAWADALLSGREAERVRLTAVVEEAEREAKECEHAIGQLSDRYDAAVSAGDDAEIALAKQAWEGRRQTAKRAALRQKAAADALAAEDRPSEGDADMALARMWEALSGEMDAVKGETAALNAALRRWFERFEFHRDTDGSLKVVPILSVDAARELVRQHPPGSPHEDDGPPRTTCVSAFTPGVAAHEKVELGEQVLGYVPNARWGTGCPLPVDELAAEPLDGPQFRISVTADALTAETSHQSGKQHLSHLPHNTRPGSWPGTAGGGSRRSRRDARRRARGARS
jgi:DNA invertase Pin-like site-specific DNA recombinase